ncbi:MAG TPA: hypothetical protein VLV89_13680 [Candidatus Acidoferrum sp.]|nr:hypothetical protein [Candidatus Acidoferrum sp.]
MPDGQAKLVIYARAVNAAISKNQFIGAVGVWPAVKASRLDPVEPL